jgi:cation diffusion facilitator CzcD-associated flavoprotein CzcO
MTGKRDYEIGKGKPPKHTQIKPGQVLNPGGKTRDQKRLEMENATLATQAKNRFLRALVALQAEQSTEEVMASFTGADILRLIKDAEDRAHGTPRQAIDHTSSDGSMAPKPGVDLSKLSTDALAELVAARDAATKD